jgi:hypothetical protein
MTGEPLAVSTRPARLTRQRRLGVYLVGGGLWLTGALWLGFHYVVRGGDGIALRRHPLEPWWLTLHGGFAYASLWVLGLLWGIHIVAGWSSGQRRWSGSLTLAALACLIVSGYLLYYLGDETLRAGTSVLHWALGLASPIVFLVHRLARKRQDAAVIGKASGAPGFGSESADRAPADGHQSGAELPGCLDLGARDRGIRADLRIRR